MFLTGVVGSGKGFDGRRNEWGEVEEVLGFKPFPGTLNVGVKPIEATFEDKTIPLFDSFLGIKGTLNDQECFFCYSTRRNITPLIDTFYVISEVGLRKVLNLQDKDRVRIKLFIPEENK
jgi:CTP-dependent riboflavin kinase